MAFSVDEDCTPFLSTAVREMAPSILERLDSLTLRNVREEIIKSKGLDPEFFSCGADAGLRRRRAVQVEVDAIVLPVVRKRVMQKRDAEQKNGSLRAEKRNEITLSRTATAQIDICKRAGLSYAWCFKNADSSEAIEARLQSVLEKEGLSVNSSVKETKEVKKARARARELEGIDVKNVISASGGRKRSAQDASGSMKQTQPLSKQAKSIGGEDRPTSGRSDTDATVKPAAVEPENPASDMVANMRTRRLVLDDDDDDW